MRQTMTISLPMDLKKEVDVLVKQQGLSRSDIMRQSLDDFIYFKKLDELHRKMTLKAVKNGIRSEQDVFDRVS